jgi:hypothetical protein
MCVLLVVLLANSLAMGSSMVYGAGAMVKGPPASVTVTPLAPGEWGATIGEFYGEGQAWVMPVQLPTLGEGKVFAGADLQIFLQGLGGGGHNFNIDLYGLSRIADTADVIPADFYIGGYDSAATLLQDNLLTPSSATGSVYHTGGNELSDTVLVNWFNGLYNSGANAGKFAFVRFNPDRDYAGGWAWMSYVVTTLYAGGANERPVITFSETPEPATLLLLGLGGLVLRKRK